MTRLLLLVALLGLWTWEYASVRTAGLVFEDPLWTEACAPSPNPVPMAHTLRGVPRWLAQESWCWQLGQPLWAFHLVNVLLHGLISLLFGVLVYQLTENAAIGWSLGALFLLHPMAIESAGYAAGRGELIAALGVLVVCVAILAGQWVLALIGLGLGILGKETALVAVMLVPLLLRWSRVVGGLLIAGVLAGIFVAGRQLDGLAWLDQIAWALLQATAAVRLTVLAIVPWGQTPMHDYHVALFWQGLAAILIAGLIGVAILWRNRLGALGVSWLLVTLAPRLLVPTPYSVLNEHQFYVPLMGLGLIAASFLVPHASPDRG